MSVRVTWTPQALHNLLAFVRHFGNNNSDMESWTHFLIQEIRDILEGTTAFPEGFQLWNGIIPPSGDWEFIAGQLWLVLIITNKIYHFGKESFRILLRC